MTYHNTNRPRYVLIIEENVHHAELLTEVLDRHFAPVIIHTVDSFGDGMEFLSQSTYDLVLTVGFVGAESVAVYIKDILALSRGTPVIVITGRGDEALAAKLTRKGVAEYLVKTKETLDKLPAILGKQLEKSLRLRSSHPYPRPKVKIAKNELLEIQNEVHLLKKNISRIPTIPKAEQIEGLQKQLEHLHKLTTSIAGK